MATTTAINQANATRAFVVTGFGPFGGVEENPSTVIVRKIGSYLRSQDETHSKNETSVAGQIRECLILETSARAVDEALERIQNDYCCSDSSKILLLHLGVGRSEGFRLESCAYNEATFRIPDIKGYQPKEQAIVSLDPVGHSYPTSLDLEALQKQMDEDFPNISTVISIDPGRFVCNYVYCKSLEVANIVNNTSTSSSCCESLFLHVPHFAIIPEDEQLAYVACLIRNLAKCT